MKNSVVATVEFYFKGERFAPSMHIDLDACMRGQSIIDELYPALAAENGIDTYSYMYEVMESESIQFSDACGLAKDFVRDGKLDMDGFKRAWQQQQTLDAIRPIARECLNIDELEHHPGLLKALSQAYRAGRSAAINPEHRD